MVLPEEVNVLGKRYSIIYVDNPAEVDILRRKSLWGQIDYWTRTIRVYTHDLPVEDTWHTILHEVIHAIVTALKIKTLQGDDEEDVTDLLALALADVFIRNDWLRWDQEDVDGTKKVGGVESKNLS